jgi:hypothetical protein
MRESRSLASRCPGLLALAVLSIGLGLGCTIAPVVDVPETPSGRYGDCEHAAERYCEQVLGATGRDLQECVAARTFQCVSGAGA